MTCLHQVPCLTLAARLTASSWMLAVLILLPTPQTNTQSINCDSCPSELNSTVSEASNATCKFSSTLCQYKQGCVGAGGQPWQPQAGYVEVIGAGNDYTAYSTLLPPTVMVRQNSCLKIYFAQTLPSKLTIISNGRCIFSGKDAQQEVMLLQQASVPPGKYTLEFRAQNLANEKSWVRIKSVSLETGACSEIKPIVLTKGSGSRNSFGYIISLSFVMVLLWIS